VLEPTLGRMDSNAVSVHPQHALAVYAGSLASGARVAVFGDASLALGARLVDQGAHAVEVWDPDPLRARVEAERAPRDVTVRAYSNESDVRTIDLAIVADLGLFADPTALIARVRRMVGDEGVALVAAKSAEVAHQDGPRGFDYYELFDLIAPEFQSVRMVAELPFHGIALVELGTDEESSVSVDTQLGERGRAPEAFVVVASQCDARLDPYAIVELPVSVRGEARPADQDALALAHVRVTALEGETQALRARAIEAERVAGATGAVEEALRSRTARAAELEKSLAGRNRELAELSSEVEEMRATAEAGRIAAMQVEELARRADRAERRVAALEQEVAKGGDSQSKELARIEEALLERAKATQLLESELARRDQMVRDLVGTLDEMRATRLGSTPDQEARAPEPEAAPRHDESKILAEDNGRLRAQLDALAIDLARREGDAQATAWQVAELGRQLAQATAEAKIRPTPDSGDPRLARALDELDALRAALYKEHEARVRAESGAELTQARAEIERQSVLMEQLARELETRPSPGPSADSR
jgi:hypothetical protein